MHEVLSPQAVHLHHPFGVRNRLVVRGLTRLVEALGAVRSSKRKAKQAKAAKPASAAEAEAQAKTAGQADGRAARNAKRGIGRA